VDSPAPNHRLVGDACEIASERLRRLHGYWAVLRGDRFAPARSELSPVDMKDQLAWIWIMDVIEGGDDFRFRLGGDRVIQFFGRRLAGETLRTVIPEAPLFFGRFFDLVRMAAVGRKPSALGPTQTAYEPRSYLEVEALLLPLSDDGVNVTGLLGCIETRPITRPADPHD
jgi:hypothetical protein